MLSVLKVPSQMKSVEFQLVNLSESITCLSKFIDYTDLKKPPTPYISTYSWFIHQFFDIFRVLWNSQPIIVDIHLFVYKLMIQRLYLITSTSEPIKHYLL